MLDWTAFPQLGVFGFTPELLRQQWWAMHSSDGEPLPANPTVLDAWVHFHNGAFEMARKLGLLAAQTGDPSGLTVANKATCVHATYLEQGEQQRQDLFLDVARRAEQQVQQWPDSANAWYLLAYATARYTQSISVSKALAMGLSDKIVQSLQKTLTLCPQHAEAHLALGTYHADLIDKVGSLIANMTYGVRKDQCLEHLQEALRLNPESPQAMIEYANALIMLEGNARLHEATDLYQNAAARKPLDATEMLTVELAKAELKS